MTDTHKFEGYKWEALSDAYPEHNAYRHWVQSFFDNINWTALCRFASELNDGKDCAVDPQWTIGGRHMIRVINFQDGSRWIARLRMTTGVSEDEQSELVQREVDCLRLVKDRSTLPVPMVFGYIASTQNEIGAPFMLMECLPGNIGPDLNGDTDHGVPSQHKSSFYTEMARLQTEMASITFPKIGAIVRLEDGTYDVGPLPRLGGPFNTATEYLKAWAKAAHFPDSSQAKEACGEYYDDVMTQIADFPHKLEELAASIPVRDHGPFPLFHPDFGHNNIIVDDNYNVLGVIDWEHACSVPWECIYFPVTLSLLPAAMDAPGNYDENGIATNADIRSIIYERTGYIDTVKEVERSKGLSSLLSTTLADQGSQDLAYAMKLYTEDGKFGFYTNLLEVHHKKWIGGKKEVDVSDRADTAESLWGGVFPPIGALLSSALHAAHGHARRALKMLLGLTQRLFKRFGLA